MRTIDFAKMLELGLGRAVLYAREHDMTPFRDMILNACLHCQSYDAQLDGTRGAYMFEIINSTPDVVFYREGILAGLAALTVDDSYDVPQRYHLTGLFAAEGDAEARQAMYDKFSAQPALEEYAGIYEIVQLDNVDGLKFVAARVGAELAAEEDWYVARRGFNQLKEQIGEEAANVTFAKMFAEPTTHAFAELIAAQQKSDNIYHPPVPTLTYAELKALIEQGKSVNGEAVQWSKSASLEELTIAAHDLLSESDPKRLEKYLRIFLYTPFPLEPTLLFPLTEHDNERIWNRTITVLKKVSHPAVRQFALDNIAQNYRIGRMVDLVVMNNYQAGDWAFLETLIERVYQDAYECHGLGLTIEQLFEVHPSDEAERSLLNMYESGPCGRCRAAFVCDLRTLGKLPDWMRDECHHDFYSDTREFIEALDSETNDRTVN